MDTVPYPLAYLITWSCHGHWLHGDDRGSVDRRRNVPGTPLVQPDPARVEWNRARLKGSPVILSTVARQIVEQTIQAHCALRKWELFAVNARSNHIHVVVEAGIRPEDVMGRFKAWCSRRLREQGHVLAESTVWTPHGSTRYLWNEDSVAAAVRYVQEAQDVER